MHGTFEYHIHLLCFLHKQFSSYKQRNINLLWSMFKISNTKSSWLKQDGSTRYGVWLAKCKFVRLENRYNKSDWLHCKVSKFTRGQARTGLRRPPLFSLQQSLFHWKMWRCGCLDEKSKWMGGGAPHYKCTSYNIQLLEIKKQGQTETVKGNTRIA